jgi:cytochrome c-type biogenesis protein CcmH/NrfG
MSVLGGLAGLVVCLAVLAVPLFLLGLLAYGLWQTWQRWQRARRPFPEPYDAGCQRAAAAIAYDNGYWTTYRELGSYRIT